MKLVEREGEKWEWERERGKKERNRPRQSARENKRKGDKHVRDAGRAIVRMTCNE